MDLKITVKGVNVTDGTKDFIYKKLESFSNFSIDKISVLCNENRQGINIKLNFNYNKKLIKIEKGGKDFYSTLNNVIEIAYNQIEKIDIKKKSKNKKSFSEEYNCDFDLNTIQKSLESFNNNLNCHEFLIDDILATSSNKNDKKEKLSFENACIKLELFGYDLFYFKDEKTNKDKVVYKDNNEYILSDIN